MATVDVLPTFGVCLADVIEQRIVWRSRGRLARGKITMLDGDPGQGKTMMALDWAARISRGDALADGTPQRERGVVILGLEDDPADTLKPRLRVMGADLNYITFIRHHPTEKRYVRFPDDMDQLIGVVDALDTGLIIIDPFNGFMAPGKSSNSNEEIREYLNPINELCTRTGASGLLLRHFNKAGGGNSLYRGMGSIGIIGIARLGLVVAMSQQHPGLRVVANSKNNLTPTMASLLFGLEQIPGEDHPRVIWHGETTENSDEVLLDPTDRADNAEAEGWLAEVLKSERAPAAEVVSSSRRAQISERALKAAKKKLHVISQREGFGPGSTVYWSLPANNSFAQNGHHRTPEEEEEHGF